MARQQPDTRFRRRDHRRPTGATFVTVLIGSLSGKNGGSVDGLLGRNIKSGRISGCSGSGSHGGNVCSVHSNGGKSSSNSSGRVCGLTRRDNDDNRSRPTETVVRRRREIVSVLRAGHLFA